MADGVLASATRLSEGALHFLKNATEEERNAFTVNCEEGLARVTKAEGGYLHDLDLPFPLALANRILVNHNIRRIRRPSIFLNPGTIGVLIIIMPHLPSNIKDVRWLMLWLEDYARTGELPEIKAEADRRYLLRFLYLGVQFRIAPLVEQIQARLEEITAEHADDVRWSYVQHRLNNEHLRAMARTLGYQSNGTDLHGATRATPTHLANVLTGPAGPEAISLVTPASTQRRRLFRPIPNPRDPRRMIYPAFRHLPNSSDTPEGRGAISRARSSEIPPRRSLLHTLQTAHVQSIMPNVRMERLREYLDQLPSPPMSQQQLERVPENHSGLSLSNGGRSRLEPSRETSDTAPITDDTTRQPWTEVDESSVQRNESGNHTSGPQSPTTSAATNNISAKIGGLNVLLTTPDHIRSPHTPANSAVGNPGSGFSTNIMPNGDGINLVVNGQVNEVDNEYGSAGNNDGNSTLNNNVTRGSRRDKELS